MHRISRSIVAMGCVLIGMSAAAAEISTLDYFCPKYEAYLQFDKQRVLRSYGREFSSPEYSSYTRTGTSSSHLADCSTKGMFCLEERVGSQTPDGDVFVYALPRQVTIGDTYQIHGVHFRVDRYPQFPGLSPSAMIFAEGKGVRYKMYIEEGRGIKQFYFAALRAASAGSAVLNRKYSDITCALVSKHGLFADVRVQVPGLPTDVIDY